MEETLTDKEFCKTFKIDRATSLRWREQGIVGFVKLPNGQVRYRQKHIDQLWANFEKMDTLGVTLKDIGSSLKGRVVSVSISERGSNVCVAEDTTNLSDWKPALHESSSAGVA